MSNTIPKAFFAYPSSHPTLREPVQDAVRELNAAKRINITTWEECSTGGKFVINTICDAIDEASIFFADLTGLNANVMFELGYAISCDKRVWLIFDETYTEEKKMFDQLKVLTTVGYRPCCNSQDIISAFYKDNPTADLENTIYRTAIKPNLNPGGDQKVFYLKSQHENQAAMKVSNLLDKRLKNKIMLDDPRETPVQTLTWYGIRVFNSKGLICHFTNPKRKGAYLQTALHALVCGMAYGAGVPLLMLAEGDFLYPIDCREFLKPYNTARDATTYLEEWLPLVEKNLATEQGITAVRPSPMRLEVDLSSLSFGESVAESEAEKLVSEYFVPTAAYNDALRGTQRVFVGRKGSGKTANLIKLEDELSKYRQNLVCVIKPPSYQMQGIVDLLKQYQRRDFKGNTIESLWKFLLLTEIANAAYHNPSSTQVNTVAQDFFDFVGENEGIICEDFSTRLETCIQNLEGAIERSNEENSYFPVSEALHSGTLKQLRTELGTFLSNEQRVVILVDNLDQAWEQHNDIEALSEILWGLLEVTQKLPMELGKQDNRRQSIQLDLAIFLRSDIFYKIREVSREPDKMPYSLLRWDDTELLCRIIEKRFISSFETPIDSAALWEQYFCPATNGIPTREYITETVLKRPRDIIHFVNEAVTTAINRGHIRIEEEDISAAEKQYSEYVFKRVNLENTLTDINLEGVIFGFAGRSVVLPKSEVIEVLKSEGVLGEQIKIVIDFLHELTFLGLEAKEDDFVFFSTPEEFRIKQKLAERLALRKGTEERFQIHRAFRAYLEIE